MKWFIEYGLFNNNLMMESYTVLLCLCVLSGMFIKHAVKWYKAN